jgi:hypothetical protein
MLFVVLQEFLEEGRLNYVMLKAGRVPLTHPLTA